jgi:dTDP-4-dehydrorhamnose 3,5-epimerase
VAEVHYKCTGLYAPTSEGSVRWDDPALGIEWPYRDPVLSAKDADAPSLSAYLQDPAFYYGQ